MKLREGPVENGGDVAFIKVSEFVFGNDGGFLRFGVSGELSRVFGGEFEVDGDEVGDSFAAGDLGCALMSSSSLRAAKERDRVE